MATTCHPQFLGLVSYKHSIPEQGASEPDKRKSEPKADILLSTVLHSGHQAAAHLLEDATPELNLWELRPQKEGGEGCGTPMTRPSPPWVDSVFEAV